MKKRPIVAAAVVGLLGVAASAYAAGSVTLNGAGSTFAAPIYQQLGSELRSHGITLNYQAVGSGAGVAQFTAGKVDFAGSDPPLTNDEVAAASRHGGPVQHIPIALGAITVSYNLPGVKTGLRLDGGTLGNIFLGRIKTWNAPAIAHQNRGVKLPKTAITVVHRSDSSGTTKGFTQFLADHNVLWKNGPGVNKDIKWPVGTGAKGNPGVAAAVKQTRGAIGYVELAYAVQNHFTVASVRNRRGRYVFPTRATTSAAGTGLRVITPALRFTVIDSSNAAAYPISSQTFVIVHRDLCAGGMNPAQANGMARFLHYALGQGQATIARLLYAPIPAGGIKTRTAAAVKSLTCHGSPALG